MGYPHEIRLRGPWDYEPLAASDPIGGTARRTVSDLPQPGRISLPADWGNTLGPEFRGRVRYRRRFGRPPQLDPHERLWLVVEGVDARGSVAVNEQKLGEVEGYALPAEWDVTDLLEPRNQLDLLVELPEDELESASHSASQQLLRPGREGLPGGPIRDVRLEVRSTHFVDRLGIEVVEQEQSVRLLVSGRVVGPATDQPLTLVVSGWGGELLVREVAPGVWFQESATIERLARGGASTDSDGLGGLATLAVRLLGPHGRLWEVQRRTSHRTCRWDAETQQLTVAGTSTSMPIDWLRVLRPLGIPQMLHTHGDEPPEMVLSDTIWTDDDYERLDRAGWHLVQAVPGAWADRVCPRLSHHPSIVAWTAPAAELSRIELASRAPIDGQRPWIPLEIASARET